MVTPEPGAGWSPRRIGGPVVVVAGSVVVGSVVVGWVVVGSALVVGSSVVVGSTVLVGAVVLGSMVVVGAVTVGSVVVAPPDVDGAPVVVVRPTLAGTPVVADRAVVAGPLAATRAVSGVLVDGVREVLGSRGRVVVLNADVGVGLAGKVDSAAPLGGAGSWGTRAAEATRAASTDAVSPKATSMSRQGNRRGSRCRGGRLGMAAVVPVD
jgi:hypothetical protein